MKVLFIPGHGGIIDGVYQTYGKRSPIWPDGRQLFEGDFNRKIVNKLVLLCNDYNIDCKNIVPELEDISLKERVNRVNKEVQDDKNVLLIEVHANAASTPLAKGFEFFTSKGTSASDNLADVMVEEYRDAMPEIPLRADTRDGDLDKDRDFYIIKHTYCPAILIETAFMTNEIECKMMLDEEDRFVEAIFNGILTVKSKYG